MAGIFKAYDIRGIVGENLTETEAHSIGLGLAIKIFGSGKSIVVSRDMRQHSEALSEALIQGLLEGGCNVTDIGLAATPMNYWANQHFKADGSVQVTASHNGPKYNGFKVSGPNASPVGYAEGLQDVEAFVIEAATKSLSYVSTQAKGKLSKVAPDEILDKYLSFMSAFLKKPQKKLKIAVDCANGMGGYFMPAFAERHPELEIVPLYWELDGTFPNHEADPIKAENLHDLQKLVKHEKCDFGVAFDGDADRCALVDEHGDIVPCDLLTALLGAQLLKRYPGSPVVYDIRSSAVVHEWIEAHGGQPLRGKVGHSFMKKLLKESGACLGGELSGHYYFKDCFNTDSALMALLETINIWQESNQGGLSSFVAPLRKYYATGEINFIVNDAKKVQELVQVQYAPQGAEIDYLDGLSVKFEDWWFNLRASNTEPLLRLNLEAKEPALREAKLAEVSALIQAIF